MSTLAFRRTRRPMGGRTEQRPLPASCRAGKIWPSQVRGAVKRSAWRITPVETLLQRTSPGKIGRPAASALVQPSVRRLFERNGHVAPDPAYQPVEVLRAAYSS